MSGSKRKYDLKIGDNFGAWEIIDFAEPYVYNDNDIRIRWVCRCECGTTKTVLQCLLVSGRSSSCGCRRENNPNWGKGKHGLSKTKLYSVYHSMRQRCENPNDKRFNDYGGRGISVCEEWLGENGFENFYKWAVSNGYKDDGNCKLTIDRIDVNGNYEPSNCRWADYITQANNTTRNHLLSHNGETHTLSEWARIIGKSPSCLSSRIRRGWNVEKVLSPKKYNSKGVAI